MRRKRFRLVILIFVLLAVLCGVLYANRNSEIFGGGGAEPLQNVIHSIESTRQHDYYIYGKNLLIVNNEGLTVIDKNGSELWHLDLLIKSPIIKISGKYILAADSGGRDAALVNDGKLVAAVRSEQPIITAQVNDAGLFALVTGEVGYKNKVSLYTRAGEDYYTWWLSEDYVLSVDISKDGSKLVGSLVSTKDNQLSGIISVIDVNKEVMTQKLTYPGEIFPEIKFMGDGSAIAVGDSSALRIDKKNDVKWKLDFGGRVLDAYDLSSGGNWVAVFQNSRNTSNIEIYGLDGKLRGSTQTDYQVTILNAQANTIAACGLRQLVLYNYKGKVKSSVETQKDFKWVGLAGRGEMMIVSGSSVEYLKP